MASDLIKFTGIFVVLAFGPSIWAAEPGLRGDSGVKLAEAIDSANWSCDYIQRSTLKNSSDGAPATSLITAGEVKCIGKKAKQGTYAVFHIACSTPVEADFPSLKECALYDNAKRFSWEKGPVTSDAEERSKDKYRRKCTYNTPDHSGRIAYRRFPDGSYDATCFTPIACDTYSWGPKHRFVACKAKEVAQKDGSVKEECPSPVECVERELPLILPLTQ